MQGPEFLERMHPVGTRIFYGSHEAKAFEPTAGRIVISMLDPARVANITRQWPTGAEVTDKLLGQFDNTKVQLVGYFEGEYSAVHHGGIGNPTAHFLYGAFAGAWIEMIDQLQKNGKLEKPLNPSAYQNAQDILLAQGMFFMSAREEIIDTRFNGNRGAYLKASDSTERAHFEGLMAEYEAGYLLAEVALRQNLIVIPAPGFLERGRITHARGNRNIDYLLFDPATQEACGVQVKAAAGRELRQSLDLSTEPIYLFDGREHLNNVANAIDSSDPRMKAIEGTFGGKIIKDLLQRAANTRERTDPIDIVGMYAFEITRAFNKAREQKGRRHIPKTGAIEEAYTNRVIHLWSRIRGYLDRSDPLGEAPKYMNEIGNRLSSLLPHSKRIQHQKARNPVT